MLKAMHVKCIPDSINCVGIVPWKCNSAGTQWEELQLHGRNQQNDIKYLRPGQSTTVGVNDWLVFDMYRRDPLQIFRLVTVPTPCTTRGGGTPYRHRTVVFGSSSLTPSTTASFSSISAWMSSQPSQAQPLEAASTQLSQPSDAQPVQVASTQYNHKITTAASSRLSILINQSDDVNSNTNVTPTMAHTV